MHKLTPILFLILLPFMARAETPVPTLTPSTDLTAEAGQNRIVFQSGRLAVKVRRDRPYCALLVLHEDDRSELLREGHPLKITRALLTAGPGYLLEFGDEPSFVSMQCAWPEGTAPAVCDLPAILGAGWRFDVPHAPPHGPNFNPRIVELDVACAFGK